MGLVTDYPTPVFVVWMTKIWPSLDIRTAYGVAKLQIVGAQKNLMVKIYMDIMENASETPYPWLSSALTIMNMGEIAFVHHYATTIPQIRTDIKP